MNRRQFLKHLGAASLAAPAFTTMQLRAATSDVTPARTFLSRLQPAVVGGGFELPDYWIWCGAPIRGEDGHYYLFASRVPKEVPFHPHWLFRSEIVRAEAEKPVGPYRFAELALPARGG
ncbi:MAG TPA: twin-arginine translocation signal domain-containing protein, partial [Verrucomicrobiae bacterium]|nr:twin-arginine translocation signal domain-containing protein [Verrucomicrobiae bacterium]